MIKKELLKLIIKHFFSLLMVTFFTTILILVAINLIKKNYLLAVGHISSKNPINILYFKTVVNELLPNKNSTCTFNYIINSSSNETQPMAIKIECYTKNVDKGLQEIEKIKKILKKNYNINIKWDIPPMHLDKHAKLSYLFILILAVPIATIEYIGWHTTILPFKRDLITYLKEKNILLDNGKK